MQQPHHSNVEIMAVSKVKHVQATKINPPKYILPEVREEGHPGYALYPLDKRAASARHFHPATNTHASQRPLARANLKIR